MIRVWDVFTINKSLDIYITTHHGSSLPKDGRDARITIFYQTEKCLLCKLLINSSRTLIIFLNNANKDDYCEIYEGGYFTFNDNNTWQACEIETLIFQIQLLKDRMTKIFSSYYRFRDIL